MGKKAKKNHSKNKNKEIVSIASQQATQQVYCRLCYEHVKKQHKNVFTCEKCHCKFHKTCIDPKNQLRQSLCDQCKHRSGNTQCFICKDNVEHIITKYDGNHYFHLTCLLFSTQFQFDSFLTMKVINRRGSQRSMVAQCKVCPQKQSNKEYSYSILSCQLCNYSLHSICAIVLKHSDQITFVTNLLNICERQNYLLDFILKKKSPIRQLLRFQPHKIQREKLLICQEHQAGNKKFCWCPCGNPDLNSDDEAKLIGCDKCDRYSHVECTGLGHLSNEELAQTLYICPGCKNPKNKDIFIKQMKIHEILEQITKIQKSPNPNLTDKQIRFLNAFPFHYSIAIQKKISDNQKQIQQYFLKNQLLAYINRPNDDQMQIELTQQEQKNIRLIVMFMINGQKKQVNSKKLKSPEQIKNIMEDLQSTKHPILSDQLIIKNVRDIFKKLQIEYNNNTEHIFTHLKQKIVKLSLISQSNNANHSQSNFQEISTMLFDISQVLVQIKSIQNKADIPENYRNFLPAFQERFKDTLFWVLLDQHQSKQQMRKILQKYGSIKILLQKRRDVKQDFYWQFKQKYFKNQSSTSTLVQENSQQQLRRTKKFLQNNFKKLKVKSAAVIKQEKMNQLRQDLMTQKKNYQDIEQMRLQVTVQNIAIFGGDIQFQCYEAAAMERNILRKKFRAICRKSEDTLNQTDLKYIPKIQTFIKEFQINLTPQDLILFRNTKSKLNFINFLLKTGLPLIESMQSGQYPYIDSQDDNSNKINQVAATSMKLIQKVKHILRRWNDTVIPHQFIIKQLKQIIQNRVKFDDPEIGEQLQNLIQKLCNLFEKYKREGKRTKGPILRDLIGMIKIYNKEQKFQILINQHNSYEQWYNINPSKTNFAKILQSPQQNQNLLRVIEHRINQRQNLSFFDLTCEIRKMKNLKIWCQISEKIFSSTKVFGSKKKPTINAIQNIKNYCDKLNYPQNRVLHQINKLYNESLELNREIAKFLDKPKYSQFIQIYEQLKIMKNKLKYDVGLLMKPSFQKSNLDINAQIQQLEQQLKQHDQIPKNLQSIINAGNLAEIKKIRVKCLDSAFQYYDLNAYYKLIMKLYQLKCKHFSGPISKKQYYQLINLGGIGSLQLLQKTSNLNRVYKQLQKAQQQISTNCNIHKRNFMNLIPWDQKRFKQIKHQLKIDPTQLIYFQKTKQHTAKIRQSYIKYRNGNVLMGFTDSIIHKIQLKKLCQFQTDLYCSIFNNKQLINDIQNLIKQHQDLVTRLQSQLLYNRPIDTNFIQKSELAFLQKFYLGGYKRLKIRNDSLDAFEKDCKLFKQIRQVSKILFLEGANCKIYTQFNMLCKNLNQNFCKLKEVMDIRERGFQFVYQKTITIVEPIFQIWDALIDEGLSLKQLKSRKSEQIFNKIFDIYAKKKEVLAAIKDRKQSSNNQIAIDQQDQVNDDSMLQQQEQDSDNQDNFDDDSELMDDYDDDEDDYEDLDSSESSGGHKNNHGRKMAPNQIVLDDD